MKPKGLWLHSQQPARCLIHCEIFCNMVNFYDDELLAPRPTPKLEDHTLSSVRNCLLNIIAATLHIEGRSSICNLRTWHAVVTGTHLSWVLLILGSVMLENIMCCVLCLSKKCGQDDRLPLWWYKGYVSPLEDAPHSSKQWASRVEACCHWYHNCHVDDSEQEEGDHAV